MTTRDRTIPDLTFEPRDPRDPANFAPGNTVERSLPTVLPHDPRNPNNQLTTLDPSLLRGRVETRSVERIISPDDFAIDAITLVDEDRASSTFDFNVGDPFSFAPFKEQNVFFHFKTAQSRARRDLVIVLNFNSWIIENLGNDPAELRAVFDVYVVTEDWDPLTITFDTRPGVPFTVPTYRLTRNQPTIERGFGSSMQAGGGHSSPFGSGTTTAPPFITPFSLAGGDSVVEEVRSNVDALEEGKTINAHFLSSEIIILSGFGFIPASFGLVVTLNNSGRKTIVGPPGDPIDDNLVLASLVFGGFFIQNVFPEP